MNQAMLNTRHQLKKYNEHERKPTQQLQLKMRSLNLLNNSYFVPRRMILRQQAQTALCFLS